MRTVDHKNSQSDIASHIKGEEEEVDSPNDACE